LAWEATWDLLVSAVDDELVVGNACSFSVELGIGEPGSQLFCTLLFSGCGGGLLLERNVLAISEVSAHIARERKIIITQSFS
jgi:hypothetical protein